MVGVDGPVCTAIYNLDGENVQLFFHKNLQTARKGYKSIFIKKLPWHAPYPRVAQYVVNQDFYARHKDMKVVARTPEFLNELHSFQSVRLPVI
jgi:hypothetical protein